MITNMTGTDKARKEVMETLAKAETPKKPRRNKLKEIRDLVADDSWSLTFQSFGQYRSALLKEIDERMKR